MITLNPEGPRVRAGPEISVGPAINQNIARPRGSQVLLGDSVSSFLSPSLSLSLSLPLSLSLSLLFFFFLNIGATGNYQQGALCGNHGPARRLPPGRPTTLFQQQAKSLFPQSCFPLASHGSYFR